MNEKLINDLLTQITVLNVTILGYMLFLSEKKLDKEAQEYVKGFVEVFTGEEWQKMFENTKQLCLSKHAQEVSDNATDGSAK